jgi:hypothetical protein
MRFALRALVWLAFSAGLLLAGFAVLSGALLAQALLVRGGVPGPVQREALGTVFSGLVTQALLPVLVLAFATWLPLARLAPRLERSRGPLLLGLFACAAAWFPLVGHYSFAMWTPRHAGDYAATLALIAGGAALALWLPRILSAALAPGCFTKTPERGIVPER